MYQGEYQLIGSELSLFTRKLEAQLRYQQIPWRYLYKTEERKAELEARAGTHFIPLLQTPDKWLLHDTITIGPMLSERFDARKVVPSTPLQRACCFILEDAFNHWLGRVCVHSRWCYPDNVAWVGPRFGANLMLDRSIDAPFSEAELEQLAPIGPMMFEGFGKQVCEVNAVGPEQGDAVRGDFSSMLNTLGSHFSQHRFLLGGRPCLADFALAGASKAHFITDPEPLSWLGEHREMLTRYTNQFFDEQPLDKGEWLDGDTLPDTLTGLLEYFQGSYFKAATINIAAGLVGEKYYEYDCGFGPTRARTQKRLNQARRHVQDELNRIGAEDNAVVQAYFAGRGILEYYFD